MIVFEYQRGHVIGNEIPVRSLRSVRVKLRGHEDLQGSFRFLLESYQVQWAIQGGVGSYHYWAVRFGACLDGVRPGIESADTGRRVDDRVEEADEVRFGIAAVPAVVVVVPSTLEIEFDYATLHAAHSAHSDAANDVNR